MTAWPALLPYVLFACLSALALAGCGEVNTADTLSAPSSGAQKVSIILDSPGQADEPGDDLIDLDGPWLTWAGQPTRVTFDAATGLLRVPSAGENLSTGVRRFDRALIEGYEYTFALRSSNNSGAVAILFPFDANGQTVPVPGVASGELAIARIGQPVLFTAPAGIAGFFIQVQNAWQARPDDTAMLGLVVDELNPDDPTAGTALNDLDGRWYNWAGRPSSITWRENRLLIPPPGDNSPLTIGVRRFSSALIEGATYELGALLDARSSVLLFLFDQNQVLIPYRIHGDDNERAWHAASNAAPIRFTVPGGVSSIGLQVQGAYQATAGNEILPYLKQINAVGPSRCERVLNGSFENGLTGWLASGDFALEGSVVQLYASQVTSFLAQVDVDFADAAPLLLTDSAASGQQAARLPAGIMFQRVPIGATPGSLQYGLNLSRVNANGIGAWGLVIYDDQGSAVGGSMATLRSTRGFERRDSIFFANRPDRLSHGWIWVTSDQPVTIDDVEVRVAGCLDGVAEPRVPGQAPAPADGPPVISTTDNPPPGDGNGPLPPVTADPWTGSACNRLAGGDFESIDPACWSGNATTELTGEAWLGGHALTIRDGWVRQWLAAPPAGTEFTFSGT